MAAKPASKRYGDGHGIAQSKPMSGNPQQTDIRISFDPESDACIKFSYEGGFKHSYCYWYADPGTIICHIINCYIVDRILPQPTLRKDEYLCGVCRRNARIGIMKTDRYETGIESTTIVKYEGDCESSYDQSYPVGYQIWKCDRCGNENSDYG
jgi:hypothetical protein